VTDCCLWIGTPVYAGHAVPPVMRFISELPARNENYAVPFVTWGGVTSGIPLYEMGKLLNEKGYTVLGAAKILAVHSMMWQFNNPLGERHPDAEDDAMIKTLVREVHEKLLSDVVTPLSLDDLRYQPKEIQEALHKVNIEVAKQMLPRKQLDVKICTQCGDCVEVCPKKILRLDGDTIATQNTLDCTLCEACVDECEPGAITIDSKSDSFLFKVESTGALPPEEIVVKSAELLKERVQVALDFANSI